MSLVFLLLPMAANGQDDAEYVEELRQACESGEALSCAILGTMHVRGEGVTQDYVRAHALFNIAGSQGFDAARSARDSVARLMTPQQIAEAQALARRCSETGIAACLQ